MPMRLERVAVKDLDNTFILRPRCDELRFEFKMKHHSVSDADRAELDQTLLVNMNYRYAFIMCANINTKTSL